MKTPKLRARKMWANYYPEATICAPSKRLALLRSDPRKPNQAVPVAVIPLDDVGAMIDRATSAHYNAVQAHPYHVQTPGAMTAALTAIGVLPRARKGCK